MREKIESWFKDKLLEGTKHLPPKLKANIYLSGFGLFKVPMLLFTLPRVVEISSRRSEVKIPLSRRTQNHLGSMYFGALCVGAECSLGLFAISLMHEKNMQTMHLSFKNFHIDFLKRAEGDVHFVCEPGPELEQEIERAHTTKTRVNVKVPGYAIVPKISREHIAEFELTISLREK
jgi:hypothetical protein